MNYIYFDRVKLPIPISWKLSEGVDSYTGPEGMLDVRLVNNGVPIDMSRLELIKENYAGRQAQVEFLKAQGTNCIYCSYKHNDCIIASYSFGLPEGSEVVAVYVFQPKQESVAASVCEEIRHSHLV